MLVVTTASTASDQNLATVLSIIGLVVAVFSVLASAGVACFVTKQQVKANKKLALEKQVDDLLHITLLYPLLDSDAFVTLYHAGGGSAEERERYVTFCCFAFNVLHRAWAFCDGDAGRIDEIILAREVVLLHKKWWLGDADNRLGYPEPFQRYVLSIA